MTRDHFLEEACSLRKKIMIWFKLQTRGKLTYSSGLYSWKDCHWIYGPGSACWLLRCLNVSSASSVSVERGCSGTSSLGSSGSTSSWASLGDPWSWVSLCSSSTPVVGLSSSSSSSASSSSPRSSFSSSSSPRLSLFSSSFESSFSSSASCNSSALWASSDLRLCSVEGRERNIL